MIYEEFQSFLESRRVDVHGHIKESSFLLLWTLSDLKDELCGTWLVEVILQKTYDLMELDTIFAVEHILELRVEQDIASVVRVLQSVLLDVLPECCYYLCSRFFLDTQNLMEFVT